MKDAERMARMHEWLDRVCQVLDLDAAVLDGATAPMLDLVRDIAHGPSRPAGPMTALLIGLAAGQGAGTGGAAAADVTARVDAVRRLLDPPDD